MSIVDIFYNQTLLLTIDNSYIVGFIPLLLTIVIVDIFYNQTLLIYSWFYQLILPALYFSMAKPRLFPAPACPSGSTVKVLNHGGSGQRIQCLVEFLDGLFVRRLHKSWSRFMGCGWGGVGWCWGQKRLWLGWTLTVWVNLSLKLGEVNWNKFESNRFPHLLNHIFTYYFLKPWFFDLQQAVAYRSWEGSSMDLHGWQPYFEHPISEPSGYNFLFP